MVPFFSQYKPMSAGNNIGFAPIDLAQATNASTTYGIDGSAANNFGLGPQYMSTNALVIAQAQQAAVPSPWWLIAFVVAVLVVMK